MEFKDYYDILGVDPSADSKDIRAAYRKLARKYHPDVSKHEDAEKKFKEVAEAWQVLKDPDKRAEYDQLRAHGGRPGAGGFEPPPGWQGHAGGPDMHSGFSDFFEEIFGGGRAGFGGGFQPRRGQDVEMELPVFLEELVSGEPRKIAYRVPGVDKQGRRTEQEKTLNVKIPVGVSDGEVIRLKGQGAPGGEQSAPGDLYLRIRLVPHPLFDMEGQNLILTLPVAPWEAALGARLKVPTLSGDIQLSIPPDSQTGRKLRVKGKGLPGKAGTGDLLVQLKVVMPPSAGAHREIWERLAADASFDPRAEWRQAS